MLYLCHICTVQSHFSFPETEVSKRKPTVRMFMGFFTCVSLILYIWRHFETTFHLDRLNTFWVIDVLLYLKGLCCKKSTTQVWRLKKIFFMKDLANNKILQKSIKKEKWADMKKVYILQKNNLPSGNYESGKTVNRKAWRSSTWGNFSS